MDVKSIGGLWDSSCTTWCWAQIIYEDVGTVLSVHIRSVGRWYTAEAVGSSDGRFV